MGKHFNAGLRVIKMRLAEYAAYRTATFINIFTRIFSNLLGPLLVFFIYTSTSGIPGWNFYELLVFSSTAMISWGIGTSFFFPMVWYIGWRVDNGYFDIILLKPLKIIPEMIIESINVGGLPGVVVGFIVLIISLINIGASISLLNIIVYVYLILLSCLVLYGIAGIITGLSFTLFKAYEFMNLFWEITNLNDYPLTIYKTFIPFFLTFVFPVAIGNYYPASFLLGKIADGSLLIVLTLVSVSFAVIGTYTIKYGLRHYSSAGG